MVAVTNDMGVVAGPGVWLRLADDHRQPLGGPIVTMPIGPSATALLGEDPTDGVTVYVKRMGRGGVPPYFVPLQCESNTVMARAAARNAPRASPATPLAQHDIGVTSMRTVPSRPRPMTCLQPAAAGRFRASDMADGNETASLGRCLP